MKVPPDLVASSPWNRYNPSLDLAVPRLGLAVVGTRTLMNPALAAGPGISIEERHIGCWAGPALPWHQS